MTENNAPVAKKFDFQRLASVLTNKKVLIVLICAICAVAICVGSTVAYLTSSAKPVEATFTIGNIKLELTETTGSSYQLVPGKVVAKDPKITVLQGSEACWLFVKITESSGFDDYLTYAVADGWTHLGGYEGVYYRTVPEADENLYYSVLKDDTITVREDLTKEKMNAITTNPTISMVAYAVQSHTVDDVVDAWLLILGREAE